MARKAAVAKRQVAVDGKYLEEVLTLGREVMAYEEQLQRARAFAAQVTENIKLRMLRDLNLPGAAESWEFAQEGEQLILRHKV